MKKTAKKHAAEAAASKKGLSLGHKMRVLIVLELIGIVVLAAAYFGLIAL